MIYKLSLAIFCLSCLAGNSPLTAATNPHATPPAAAVVPVSEATLKASSAESLAWLHILDQGQYPQSWDRSSVIMKFSMPKDQWIQLMDKVRKPLGSVKSRQVLDQRTAKNPHGLPHGDYMVMYYKTSFSGKAEANELVTLFLEDGEWRVLTYQVS